jgi:transcriptional regulator of arginine metabolism
MEENMKAKRQAMILEIVSTKDVQTQDQLQEALQQAGFVCTQATISRDIKELRIVKEMTKFGTYRYASSSKEVSGTFSSRLNTIFKECITGFDYAQNMVVVHTLPGLAGAAASAVDSMQMNFILGSIAGDDTVLIIMRDNNSAAAFCGEIKNLLS